MGARRGLWIFRAVFYGATLTFLAIHFWPHVPPAELEGTTPQHMAITLRVGDDGVRALDVTLRARCAGGREWIERWSPEDGAPAHFHNDGHEFHVRERASEPANDGRSLRLDLWMTGHMSTDHHFGSGVAQFTASAEGGAQVCDSGLVAWTVGTRS